jgi:hypothetical protein
MQLLQSRALPLGYPAASKWTQDKRDLVLSKLYQIGIFISPDDQLPRWFPRDPTQILMAVPNACPVAS